MADRSRGQGRGRGRRSYHHKRGAGRGTVRGIYEAAYNEAKHTPSGRSFNNAAAGRQPYMEGTGVDPSYDNEPYEGTATHGQNRWDESTYYYRNSIWRGGKRSQGESKSASDDRQDDRSSIQTQEGMSRKSERHFTSPQSKAFARLFAQSVQGTGISGASGTRSEEGTSKLVRETENLDISKREAVAGTGDRCYRKSTRDDPSGSEGQENPARHESAPLAKPQYHFDDRGERNNQASKNESYDGQRKNSKKKRNRGTIDEKRSYRDQDAAKQGDVCNENTSSGHDEYPRHTGDGGNVRGYREKTPRGGRRSGARRPRRGSRDAWSGRQNYHNPYSSSSEYSATSPLTPGSSGFKSDSASEMELKSVPSDDEEATLNTPSNAAKSQSPKLPYDVTESDMYSDEDIAECAYLSQEEEVMTIKANYQAPHLKENDSTSIDKCTESFPGSFAAPYQVPGPRGVHALNRLRSPISRCPFLDNKREVNQDNPKSVPILAGPPEPSPTNTQELNKEKNACNISQMTKEEVKEAKKDHNAPDGDGTGRSLTPSEMKALMLQKRQDKIAQHSKIGPHPLMPAQDTAPTTGQPLLPNAQQPTTTRTEKPMETGPKQQPPKQEQNSDTSQGRGPSPVFQSPPPVDRIPLPDGPPPPKPQLAPSQVIRKMPKPLLKSPYDSSPDDKRKDENQPGPPNYRTKTGSRFSPLQTAGNKRSPPTKNNWFDNDTSSSDSKDVSPRRSTRATRWGGYAQATTSNQGFHNTEYGGAYSPDKGWGEKRRSFHFEDSPGSPGSGITWEEKFLNRYENVTVPFIDTHCHIDFIYDKIKFCGTYSKFREQHKLTYPDKYGGCVAVFCKPQTFNRHSGLWIDLLKEDNIWGAVGCHPKSALGFNKHAESHLRGMLCHEKVVALGEIGLDYSGKFFEQSEIQKTVFRNQLSMAKACRLPVVIHCRDAESDCISVLEEMDMEHYKMHRHCFTGTWAECERWLDIFPNSYIGLTPLLTQTHSARSHGPREVAKNIPLNKLLLETDSPYFVPKQVPRDVSYSHPGLAITVAEEVAKIRNMDINDLLRICLANSKDMYNLNASIK